MVGRVGQGGWPTVMMVALTLILGAPATPAAAQAGPLGGLDAYVQEGMREWEVPGLGLAIVRADSVIHLRGYGVRELGSSATVDEETLFAIGSASKAFTAAALAMLVEEGAVAWDDPATEYLPGFQLFDPYATRELTVRDLLTHRSGLSRGDELWYATGFDREEILERVRFLEPSWGFRARFGYQNLMYLAAGQIVPAVTGDSWDTFVDERIFTPLGMERTVTSALPLDALRNVASPHTEVDGEMRPIPYRNIDEIGPAGSINSSAREMAQWVRLQLGAGQYEGDRLLSEETVAEMHTPQMLVRREGRWVAMSPASHFMAYGLGWFLNDHRGRLVVQHGGNIGGMHALVGLMPEEDVGLVVLTNRTSNYLSYALMYRVFDAFVAGEPVDWSERLLAWSDSVRASSEAGIEDPEASRVAGTRPSRELQHYAGTYEHPMYGEAVVTLEEGRLRLDRGPGREATLDHWHYDTFRSDGGSLVRFALDARARVAWLEVQGLGRFDRVPEEGAQ